MFEFAVSLNHGMRRLLVGAITVMCLAGLLGANPASAKTWGGCPNLSISGSPPASVVAGQAYSFTPSVSGWHRSLSYSIANAPTWASFDTSTGALTGVPSTADEGTFSNIVITVTNRCTSTSLAPFSIQVTAPSTSLTTSSSTTSSTSTTSTSTSSTPPTISGTPPSSVTVGSTYVFQPTASDPDGDTLSFSVQNKPSWASFSIATGELTGTPASTDVGTDSNITISVSDGTSSVSLAPFSISVTSSSTTTGSADLSWTAPTTNTDGTPITNLAGYEVYYGTSQSDLSQTVQVAGSTITTCVIGQLGSGTWYFGITAYLSDGTQSAISNVVSKTIP